MSKSMISTPDGPGWVADIGGGICKTATVLNLAVEQAGLSITEQHHHSFPVDYVPSGQDTAVDQDSGWDYRFVNSQSQPVKIVASCISNTLQVQLWEL
jgi:vancomycin resistance protein YoaR